MDNLEKTHLLSQGILEFGFGKSSFSPREIIAIGLKANLSKSDVIKIMRKVPKASWGVYDFSSILTKSPPHIEKIPLSAKEETQVKLESMISTRTTQSSFIPEKDPYYVPWGYFFDIKKIIESKQFFPVFITGLSGNGKTLMVEQACSLSQREFIRIQISPETDEDDLIGGFRLLNGETVFYKGPVLQAMEAGAILLIDEIDRGSNKLMAIQSVLEGKPVLIKKTGDIVYPKDGFNIISTANTKGQGSEDGRFIASTIIDEAFLERFAITIEQDFPTIPIETSILKRQMEKYGIDDKDFIDILTHWAETIRATFSSGGVSEVISTRRLCHIIQTYSIFMDKKKSIEFCLNRFESDTKEAFLDLYEKIGISINGKSSSKISLDEVIDQAIS